MKETQQWMPEWGKIVKRAGDKVRDEVGELQKQTTEMRVNAEMTKKRREKREKCDILKDTDLDTQTNLHTSNPCPNSHSLPMALSEKSLCSCKLLSTKRQLQALVAMAICFFQAMLLSTMFNNVNNAKERPNNRPLAIPFLSLPFPKNDVFSLNDFKRPCIKNIIGCCE